MRPTIALVLGGGGIRGLAHIGVLDVLEQETIPLDLIVGTSMGGIIAALFALGLSAAEISRGLSALESTPLSTMRLISSRARQNRLREQLLPVIGEQTFSDLKIPLTLMAVDMVTGQEVALREGPLMPALLASSAVPAIFPPVYLNGMQLADGGVIDSLATYMAAEQGADKMIAVDVYPSLDTDNPWNDPLAAITGFQLNGSFQNGAESLRVKFPNMMQTLNLPLFSNEQQIKRPNPISSMWRAVRVMTWHLHQQRLAAHPPDILLRPDVNQYGSLDFKDMSGPIEAGRSEAERHLESLRGLIINN